jgi:tRNA threonylcarbamoyladenosine biosynthesis protein TsaE
MGGRVALRPRDRMEQASLDLTVSSVEETRRIGTRLGRAMGVGDVLALVGPLGSGKTTFVQGVAVGLDVPPDRHVASPTFALVNEHPARVPFVHADFYRIERPDELRELGLEEAYDRAAAALEWADRFPQAIPADHLAITFVPLPDGRRRLELRPTGPRGRALAEALR